MPQLDIDLYEDFLTFAFVALLICSEESDNSIIIVGADTFLAKFYMNTVTKLNEQKDLIKSLVHMSILTRD
jgi:hypothetical protein